MSDNSSVSDNEGRNELMFDFLLSIYVFIYTCILASFIKFKWTKSKQVKKKNECFDIVEEMHEKKPSETRCKSPKTLRPRFKRA